MGVGELEEEPRVDAGHVVGFRSVYGVRLAAEQGSAGPGEASPSPTIFLLRILLGRVGAASRFD